MESFSLVGLSAIPEVQVGDNIADLIIQACKKEAVQIVPGDIVVIASKIVSKSEGSIVELKNVKPSSRSKAIARLTGKNPVHVDLIRQQSTKIVAAVPILKISKYDPRIINNLAKDKEQGLSARSIIICVILLRSC
ncbi:MAG TPA: coenzyme F420-0:L-glutamate ligase [Candidatus Sulfotelmatobacter sp.]|nr:coenzyme F420-0:L-glutamate ligase [Candidatus Sulfotelmatobacter sp.]